jgi:hypothetical protein
MAIRGFVMTTIDSRLNHLNAYQIELLIKRYYDGDNIKDLLNEFKIDSTVSQLYKIFPLIITDNKCPYCNVNMVIKRQAKSTRNIRSVANCPNCDHIYINNCQCFGCVEDRNLSKQKELICRRESIQRVYSDSKENKLRIHELDIYDKAYLGSLLLVGIDEDLTTISPIETCGCKLSPTAEMDKNIVLHLYKKLIIRVHPDSKLDAFSDINFPYEFSSLKVKYLLNVTADTNQKKMVEGLINPYIELTDLHTKRCIYNIWRQIALHECINFLSDNMIKNGLPCKLNKKFIGVIQEMTNYFSISQVFSIINRSIVDTIRGCYQDKISKIDAVNHVMSYYKDYSTNMIENDLLITNYKLENYMQQSVLSRFFFEKIIKSGEEGYYIKPRMILDRDI